MAVASQSRADRDTVRDNDKGQIVAVTRLMSQSRADRDTVRDSYTWAPYEVRHGWVSIPC